MVMFSDIVECNDLLGTTGETGKYYIASGSRFEIARVERMIVQRSGIINEEHHMNYQRTIVSEEYIDSVGDAEVMTAKYPIISIGTLYLWNGSSYVAKVEDRDPGVGDYWIDSPTSGHIKFHSSPSAGNNRIKLEPYTYGFGYKNIPHYVQECCTRMVCIDLAVELELNEECKEQVSKWKALIRQWQDRVEYLLNKHIRNSQLSVHSIGKYRDASDINDLSRFLDG